MPEEIERRFLVNDREAATRDADATRLIGQSYVPGTGDWSIRLRRIEHERGDTEHLLTMKRAIRHAAADEHETHVPRPFHEALRATCGAEIVKTRHDRIVGDLTWEVDLFHNDEIRIRRADGRIERLLIAEIELPRDDADFDRPSWLGVEVTGQGAFSNHGLSRRIEDVRSLVAGGVSPEEALACNLLEEPRP